MGIKESKSRSTFAFRHPPDAPTKNGPEKHPGGRPDHVGGRIPDIGVAARNEELVDFIQDAAEQAQKNRQGRPAESPAVRRRVESPV